MEKNVRLTIVVLCLMLFILGIVVGVILEKSKYALMKLERNYYRDQFSNTCTLSNILIRENNNSTSNSEYLKELNCQELMLK